MSDRVRVRRVLLGLVGGIVVIAAVVVPLRIVLASMTLSGNAPAPVAGVQAMPVDVRLANGYDFAIMVTDLRVKVRTVHAPHADATHPCTVEDFVVTQFSGSNPVMMVSAHTSTTLSRMQYPRSTWPRVTIRARSVHKSACQDASLTLDYTGSRTLMLS